MSTWQPPREPEKKHEPPPKPHRPPHEATYEGLAHVSQQIADLKAQLDLIESAIKK